MRKVIGALLLAMGLSANAAGTWETTLQPRDIDGDGVTDAYYESSGNLTWLADDLLFQGGWQASKTWAAGLDVGGVTGWRLPTLNLQYHAQCFYFWPQTCDYRIDTTGSELAHLFIDVLGDLPRYYDDGFTPRMDRDPFNVGPFTKLPPGSMNFWGAEGPQQSAEAFYVFNWAPYYLPGSGLRDRFLLSIENTNDGTFSSVADGFSTGWAVHDGDVGVSPVPEPAVSSLLVLGIALLAVKVGSQRARPSSI